MSKDNLHAITSMANTRMREGPDYSPVISSPAVAGPYILFAGKMVYNAQKDAGLTEVVNIRCKRPLSSNEIDVDHIFSNYRAGISNAISRIKAKLGKENPTVAALLQYRLGYRNLGILENTAASGDVFRYLEVEVTFNFNETSSRTSAQLQKLFGDKV